jgi:hypothetical protein
MKGSEKMLTMAFFSKFPFMWIVFAIFFTVFGSSGAALADVAGFSSYNPLSLGSYWVYQNTASPFDTYTVSVFENFTFDGYPAVKIGTDANNYGIGYNSGASVSIYAYVEGGTLYDSTHTTISTITDGMFYQLGEASNYQLIRKWDNVDAAKKVTYSIDPALEDLILIAAYDSDYSHNGQNAVVESNLGISLPNYAVTHLEWYKAGVGLITTTDVFAENGAIGDRYDLIDYHITRNPVPEPSMILLFSTGLAAFAGGKFRTKGRIQR